MYLNHAGLQVFSFGLVGTGRDGHRKGRMYLSHFGLQEAPFGLTPNTPGFCTGLPPRGGHAGAELGAGAGRASSR